MPNTTLSDEDTSAFATCADTFNKTAVAADGEYGGRLKSRFSIYVYYSKIVGQTLNIPATALPPVPAGLR